MRVLMTMALLTMITTSGCATKVHPVEERFRPLERIKESVLRPGTGITTIGRTARVNDLDDWLAKHPPGGPRYDALLLHEREHTLRQEAYGLNAWLSRYMTDLDFMWAEEARGWYIQLMEYRRRGLRVNVSGVAKILAGYRNFAGRMISEEDALKWIQDVLSGRWKPGD